jgi:RNA recognition motif-containing protein
MNIHVTNLSLNVIDSDLRKLFAAYGEVNTAVIVRNKLNGRSLGTAMIDMSNDIQAAQALLCLNNTVLDGRPIFLSEIKYSIRDHKN